MPPVPTTTKPNPLRDTRLFLAGGVFLLGLVALQGSHLITLTRQVAAYDAAPTCTSNPLGAPPQPCRLRMPANFLKCTPRISSLSVYTVSLELLGGRTRTVAAEMPDPNLQAGSPVGFEMWNGRITRLIVGDRDVRTEEHPLVVRESTVLNMLLLLAGTALAGALAERRRRAGALRWRKVLNRR